MATHIVFSFIYGVGMDGWKAFASARRIDLLVGGKSWLRESREELGGYTRATFGLAKSILGRAPWFDQISE